MHRSHEIFSNNIQEHTDNVKSLNVTYLFGCTSSIRTNLKITVLTHVFEIITDKRY